MIAQLALFSEPETRRQTVRDKQEERLMSPVIEQALLDACIARPGEWLQYELYRVADALDGGSVWGHVLHRLVRKGLIEEMTIYFGSDCPSKGNYQGFSNRWRFVPRESA